MDECWCLVKARHNRWVKHHLLELRKDYERRAAPVDLSANYIYVPLHVQPERSTSPNGGIYVHSELMIETLAHAIPTNWLVYVQEHPLLFAPSNIGERGRRLCDYANFIALSNVRL